jgi:pyridinium-3,5-biscarboxylic acid mononucleotide sulfurtransferase
VAFSGGVDSTTLLYAALSALGMDNVLVLRGMSELVSDREKKSANKILDELQVDEEGRLEVELHPLIWSEFVANTPDRCYFCKKRMYQSFQRILEKTDFTVLLDGSNVDDLKSHRPGFRAIHELGIKTPLLDAGLSKDEIRAFADMYHLSNHDKPSNSCLATRLPEGTIIEKEGLRLVEKCEEFLLDREFKGCRVKPNGKDIVLELTGKDAERLVASSVRVEIIHFFQSMGFARVLVDLKARG